MINNQNTDKSLIEAALNIKTTNTEEPLNEGRWVTSDMAKHKVGDKVGIVNHGNGWGHIRHIGTGTVTKINAHGHHHVEHDDHKTMDGKNMVSKYDHSGHTIGVRKYSGNKIIKHEDYKKSLEHHNNQNERNSDIEHIHSVLAGHKTGRGDYTKLEKGHADKLHELINKHTKHD